jgi:hypothetical protein
MSIMMNAVAAAKQSFNFHYSNASGRFDLFSRAITEKYISAPPMEAPNPSYERFKEWVGNLHFCVVLGTVAKPGLFHSSLLPVTRTVLLGAMVFDNAKEAYYQPRLARKVIPIANILVGAALIGANTQVSVAALIAFSYAKSVYVRSSLY